MGTDPTRRAAALQILASDSGLLQMLPMICAFIAKGVNDNIAQHNLGNLMKLM